jgi:hypothetical protein
VPPQKARVGPFNLIYNDGPDKPNDRCFCCFRRGTASAGHRFTSETPCPVPLRYSRYPPPGGMLETCWKCVVFVFVFYRRWVWKPRMHTNRHELVSKREAEPPENDECRIHQIGNPRSEIENGPPRPPRVVFEMCSFSVLRARVLKNKGVLHGKNFLVVTSASPMEVVRSPGG